MTDTAQGAQPDEDETVNRDGQGSLPRTPLGAPVKKREADKEKRNKRRNHQNSNNGETAFPVLQPLKNGDVIPLWARHILCVRRAGFRSQRHRGIMGQQAETGDNEQCENEIEQNLSWIKQFRRLLGCFRISWNRTRRPGSAEQENMSCDKGQEERR